MRFYPYIIDRDCDMQLMDNELCVHCEVPDESDFPGFESIEEAKKALPTLAYRLQHYYGRLKEDFAGFGVIASDGYRWYIQREEFDKIEAAEHYIPYACAEDGADLFLSKTGLDPLTRDQNNAWGATTLELASEKTKQIHRIAFDSNQARFGTTVGVYGPDGDIAHTGWSDLGFESAKDNRFYPYVLDMCGDRAYLLKAQENPRYWTYFLGNAQDFTNIEDAKENIQRLVELAREDDFFDKDLCAGVVDGSEDPVFEEYNVKLKFTGCESEGSDPVNSPEHYKTGGLEAIDVVEAFFADNYLRGNVFKYIARAGKKDPNKKVEDLQKAAWYLNREIEALKGDCA